MFFVPDIPQAAVAVVALAFPLNLFLLAGIPFLKAAKRWHNRIFGPLLGAFVVAELLYQVGVTAGEPGDGTRGLILGVDLIALLLFAMGGRVIAAATSGALQRRSRRLIRAEQSRLERAGVAALAGAALADVSGLPVAAGVFSAFAGATVVSRLARISHQGRCIGPGNLRKLFCKNDLSDSGAGSDADTVYLRTAAFRSV